MAGYSFLGNIPETVWESLLYTDVKSFSYSQWFKIVNQANSSNHAVWKKFIINPVDNRIKTEILYDIFKKDWSLSSRILGPKLNSDGSLSGDADSIETYIFGSSANEYQKMFQKDLLNENPLAEKEYRFAIIGATKIWRDDIEVLLKIENYLVQEEKVLVQEEKIFEKGVNLAETAIMSDVLQRHFPTLSKDVDYTKMTSKESLRHIVTLIKKFDHEAKSLRNKILELKQKYPFIFKFISSKLN
jgi:hypothetical protein